MARTYARVKTDIWTDDEFRVLPVDAQHLYFVLLTSASLSYCGVADWRPARIAAGADGWTPAAVVAAAEVLHDRLYVVVDEATEEVLIRSFIRHDGLMEQPNVATAMVRDYAKVASRHLRGVVVHELCRLHEENPTLKGWGNASALLSNPSLNPSDNPSGWGSVNPSVGDDGTLPVTHASLLTPSPTPSPQPNSPSGARSRATKRASDWQPNDTHYRIAADLEVNVDNELDQFCDFHDAKGSTFKDWDAAFRTWLRNAGKWRGDKRNPNGTADKHHDRYMQRLAAAERNQT